MVWPNPSAHEITYDFVAEVPDVIELGLFGILMRQGIKDITQFTLYILSTISLIETVLEQQMFNDGVGFVVLQDINQSGDAPPPKSHGLLLLRVIRHLARNPWSRDTALFRNRWGIAARLRGDFTSWRSFRRRWPSVTLLEANKTVNPPICPRNLAGLWQSQRIIPLARQDTLEELSAKLKEKAPTTREYPAQRFVDTALRQYAPWCETIPPKDNTGLPECSDEKDQKFIDLAFAGEADFLITRDRALLAMDPQTPFSILDAAAFRRLGT